MIIRKDKSLGNFTQVANEIALNTNLSLGAKGLIINFQSLEKTMSDDLYFKNGKQKKKYMLCESKEKIAMFKRLYGRKIIQCVGCCCPYYSRGCKK